MEPSTYNPLSNVLKRFIWDKARGWQEFAVEEIGVVVLAGLAGFFAHPICGLLAAGGALAGVLSLRWGDNGRPEHLRLRLRQLQKRRSFCMCETDQRWRPFRAVAPRNRS